MGVRNSPSYKNAIGLLEDPEWSFSADGIQYQGNVVDGWDYQTNLQIEVETKEGLLSEIVELCSLPTSTELEAFIKWDSSVGLTTGVSIAEPLSDSKQTFIGHPDSFQIGGKLHAHLVVVIAKSFSAESVLVPSSKGMVLWESEKYTIELEGTQPSVPVTPWDFINDYLLHDKAAWAIRWNEASNYSLHASGAIQILINTSYKESYDILRDSLNSNKPEKDPLIKILIWDYTLQLLNKAITDDTFEIGDWEEESIGSVIELAWKTIFPERSVDDIRQAMNVNPERFHSHIHGARQFVTAFGGRINLND